MSTNVLSSKDIKREKHTIDATNQILGRLSTEVAKLLMGKNKQSLPPKGGKPNFYVPYLDTGDFVTVINASKVLVSGKKAAQKEYKRFSGYPGGLKTETFDKLIVRRPEAVIEHAVRGMLPKTKLGRQMFKKLTVLSGDQNG